VRAAQRRTFWILLAVMPLIITGLVVRTTQAAFTATTDSQNNQWSAGTVTLTSDANGSAVFSPTLLVPGNTGSACVTVAYGGNVPAGVKLYVSSLAGNLGTYLTFTVTEGTGGACGSLTGTSVLYGPGTLAAFAAAHGSSANGVSTWQPGGAASRIYQFDWTLQDNNLAQSQTATATFTWVAASL
jgi:hypothetical protein